MCYAIIKVDYLIKGHPSQTVFVERGSELMTEIRKIQSIEGVKKVSWFLFSGCRELTTEWKETIGEKVNEDSIPTV